MGELRLRGRRRGRLRRVGSGKPIAGGGLVWLMAGLKKVKLTL